MYVSNFAARSAFAEWLGTGRHDAFKGANLAAEDLAKLGLEPGQFFFHEGHTFRAIRARGAITGEGYALKSYMNAAGRTGTAASGTKDKFVSADTLVKGDLKGGKVWIDSGTGIGQMRNILENDDAAGASVVTVARRVAHLRKAATSAAAAFDTAPDATSTYNIHCDWEVVHSAAVGDLVVGVALGAVTDGNFSIIVVEGPYVPIRVVGSTDAATAGGLIVPSATAGTAKGPTAAGLTAVEAAVFFAQSYDAYSGAAANRICRLFGRFAIGGQRIIHHD